MSTHTLWILYHTHAYNKDSYIENTSKSCFKKLLQIKTMPKTQYLLVAFSHSILPLSFFLSPPFSFNLSPCYLLSIFPALHFLSLYLHLSISLAQPHYINEKVCKQAISYSPGASGLVFCSSLTDPNRLPRSLSMVWISKSILISSWC